MSYHRCCYKGDNHERRKVAAVLSIIAWDASYNHVRVTQSGAVGIPPQLIVREVSHVWSITSHVQTLSHQNVPLYQQMF